MNKVVNTGLRMTESQIAKADQMARSLGTTRNRLFGMLIDRAEFQAPVLSVGLEKNKRCDASVLNSQSITAVSA